MTQDEGLLKRWSRRKREQREAQRQVAAPAPTEEGVPPPDATVTASDPATVAEAPPELPPIESLTKDSDFTVFMRPGVPEEVRQQALRKLWRSDPVLANLDGMLEYGEDFSQQFKTGAVISTLYRVGRGMVDAVEPHADAAEGDKPAAEPGLPLVGEDGSASSVAGATTEPTHENDSPAKPAKPDRDV